MKKLIAVLVVLLFAAPAFAADWAFYGSQRVQSWYVQRDYGDGVNGYVAGWAGSGNGDDNDSGTRFSLQGNSRLGAKVKADKVNGQVELALTAGDGSGSDGGVNTRRAYGVWKISDLVSLKVGKDYSPVTDFISNQWFDGDGDLLGQGNFYGKRPAGITLMIGNFELAALGPIQGDTGGINSSSTGINLPVAAISPRQGVLNPVAGNTATTYTIRRAVPAEGLNQDAATGDPDVYLPKLEASYMLKLGAGYIKPYAGFQYYTVSGHAAFPGTLATQQDVTDDIDVYSYVVGVSTSWNIGAFSIGGQVSYGMNQTNANWANGYNNSNASRPYLKPGGEKIADVYTLQALIVPALKFTDTLRFEAGFGYRQDNADGAPGYSLKDESWVAYVQALITLAPGVYLCPEVGYIDFMDDRAGNNEGYQWYAGAKWQIDF
jgi:hypothetical protein